MPAHASISRRRLLAGHAQALPLRTLPPGALPENLASCTGCGQCVDACPQDILTIRDDAVLLVPEQGECTFCNACADACAQPVFSDSPAMQHVAAISDACLARRGVTCMTCRDACPESAIRFQPRAGGPFLPVLDAGLCTGCGACQAPCPAQAIRDRKSVV